MEFGNVPIFWHGDKDSNEQLQALLANVLEKQGKTLQHISQLNEKLEMLGQKFAEHVDSDSAHHILDAFPDENRDAHRRYHEAMMELVMERRRLRQAIQEKTISGLIWSGIVVVGAALYHYARGVLR